MKPFDGLSYYEILKIPPDADQGTVSRAYREALEIYDQDSLVTYALFSDEERAGLLQVIDEAFHVLSDEAKRRAYNRSLSVSGRPVDPLPPSEGKTDARPHAPSSPVRHRDLSSWVKQKSQEESISRLINEIAGRDCISGSSLKQLREACEIDIAEIFEMTRIAGSVLKMIEDDQFEHLPAEIFLRSFLKSYAQVLQIDPQHVVEGYVKHMVQATRPAKK